MNKKETLEIKRRFKKEQATFSRLAGCYVNGDHEKVCTFCEPFLTQDDDVLYKYLDIAGKTLSGTAGNNLIDLEFPLSEETPGGRQQFLMGLRECGLMNESLLDAWYDLVIENYQFTGNYLILLFMDSYDVPMKTKDDLRSGESEEIYSYILSAVCPVLLSQPGLSFHETENRIGARIRDWVVGAPESGFLFPAFNGRSADVHSVLFYTKDPKHPHTEFMENVLGCGSVMTHAEQKQAFHEIVRQVLGKDDESTEDKLLGVQKTLSDMNEEYESQFEDSAAVPLQLSRKAVEDACEDNHIPEERTERIADLVEKTFSDSMPDTSAVIDAHALKNGSLKLENAELLKELAEKTLETERLKKGLTTGEKAEAGTTGSEQASEGDLSSLSGGKRMRFRPFRDADSEEIVSWLSSERSFLFWSEGKLGSAPLTAEKLLAYYHTENELHDFYPMTACDEQGPFGHLVISLASDDSSEAHISFLVTDDERSRQGLGTSMLKLAVRYIRQFLGAESITISTFEDNASARAWLEKLGFSEDDSVPANVVRDAKGIEHLSITLRLREN